MVLISFLAVVLATGALAVPVQHNPYGSAALLGARDSADTGADSLSQRDEYGPGTAAIYAGSGMANAMLKTINAWRAEFNVQQLAWDNKLAENAKTFAMTMTVTKKFRRPEFGGGFAALQEDANEEADWVAKVRAVTNKIAHNGYTFNQARGSNEYFLSLLWKSNTKVGCGWAYNRQARIASAYCAFDKGLPQFATKDNDWESNVGSLTLSPNIDWEANY